MPSCAAQVKEDAGMAGRFRAYRELLHMLKKQCPAAFPVSVRRVKLSKLEGRCWKQGKQFQIQIDRNLDEHKAMDVLIHEWAHARAWNHRLDAAVDDAEFNKLAHDAAWGVAYAEIYSAYEQQFTHSVL
jgi:hypothetical protein